MKRALIVDDLEQNRYLLHAVLAGNGWEVMDARNGIEALDLARRLPPDLVVSDLLMPGMDGYTLLRLWKAEPELRAIPFVVYTATYTEPRDERLAFELGADAFIVKPAEPEVFLAHIDEILERAKAGEFIARESVPPADAGVMQRYSEALVHKLEQRSAQLEEANRALQRDIALRTEADARISELLTESSRSRRALLSVVEDQQRAEAELRASEERLRAFAARVQAVREEERTRVAREIHDVLAQELTRLKIDIGWLDRRMAATVGEADLPVLRARLHDMSDLADSAIEAVQNIATELRPVVLDTLGLAAAIEWQAGRFQEHTGVVCTALVPQGDLELPQDAATALFRIVQECLTNVARHAHATAVTIQLECDENTLRLAIEDNGIGFDVARVDNIQAIGLAGIRERATLLGGTATITSTSGQGVRVLVLVPLHH